MMMERFTRLYLFSVALLWLPSPSFGANETKPENYFDKQCGFIKPNRTGTSEECARTKTSYNDAMTNLPMISGAYCYNNGSGICKAFAGRYEFYYDSFNDKFLHSAPGSKWVDQNGYHKRVPVAYTINGDMMYADRSINWARKYAEKEQWNTKKPISLMSISELNWCAFVADNNWPYKSAIKWKQYQIYFFNRQSCIIDTSKRRQPKQHYNTRFLHNSTVRIDLDMNPTIYAMEDNVVNETRLIKHRRQHWYEVKFEVREKPSEEVDYFVDMEPVDAPPCKICGDRPILPWDAYQQFSNVCLSDHFHKRDDGVNARLVQEFCGIDKVEIADYPRPIFNKFKGMVLEVDLHNIPRRPLTTTSFFGVDIKSTEEWVIWAKDGLTFSAATTIPTSDMDKVRVIMLYARFKLGSAATGKYEEYEPMPYLADYEANLVPGGGPQSSRWEYDTARSTAVQAKNLNYVDDIAYLYKCESLLVIFGPFYSELPVSEKISLEVKGLADSIYSLGIWEPANAFFAMPDESSTLFVYYRTNYLAEYTYECAKPLVTARRKSGYLPRHGPNNLGVFTVYSGPDFFVSEETFFQDLGLYKGDLGSAEAPDPRAYENDYIPPAQPLAEKDQTYIYIIIAVGVLLIVTMCIICMVAVRRRIKRRRQRKTVRSGGLEDDTHPGKSTRSLLSWLPFGGSSASALHKTKRSAMSSHSPPAGGHKGSSRLPQTIRSTRTSGHPSATGSAATIRSGQTAAKPSKSAATIRSPSLNSNHAPRSASKHSRRPSRASSASSQRSAGSHHSGSQKPGSSASSHSAKPGGGSSHSGKPAGGSSHSSHAKASRSGKH